MEIMIAIFGVILFAVADGLSDAFILRWIRVTPDGDTTRNIALVLMRGEARAYAAQDFNKRWHQAQAFRQMVVIGLAGFLSSWTVIPFGAAFFWIVQDGVVNRVGLDRNFFFVGTTAWLDRQFQKTTRPELFMACTKIGLLIVGAFLLLLKF